MEKKFYIETNFEGLCKIEDFCSKNDVEIISTSDILQFPVRNIMRYSMKEEPELKELFNKLGDDELGSYNKGVVEDRMIEGVIQILDINDRIIKDMFRDCINERLDRYGEER